MISFIISNFFGIAGLGLYRSTYDALSKVWFFSNGLGAVVFPYFAGNSVGKGNYKKYIALSWAFYSIVYISLLLLYPLLDEFLLNGNFKDSTDILMFLFMVISVLLVAQGNLSFEYLQAKGNYKYLMITTLLSNVILILAALVLRNFIPYAYSVVLSWMLSLIIQTSGFESKSISKGYFWYSILIVICWLLVGAAYVNCIK